MTDIVGIDPGTVRIGVAIADSEIGLALPLGTVDARRGFEHAASMIAQLLQERDVSEVVMGLPLHMSGQESDSSRQARILGAVLERVLQKPVTYWDERLTTAQAQEALQEAQLDAKRQKDVIDQTAAAVMLQSFLDRQADDLSRE